MVMKKLTRSGWVPFEIPPDVAQAFIADMKAYFAEEDVHKRNEIAVRQLHALKEFQGQGEKPLGLSDVKAMFRQMRDQA